MPLSLFPAVTRLPTVPRSPVAALVAAILALSLLFPLLACGPGEAKVATPTATAAPVAVAPTATPSPLPTPSPTASPSPSPTLTLPSPTPAPPSPAIAAVFAQAAAVRGLTAKAEVPLGFLSREEVRPYLAKITERDLDKEDLAKEKALYVTLGLLDPDEDLYELFLDLETEQVLGFYEFAGREMKVVSTATGAPLTPLDELTLAHEYVHALQDQHFGLGSQLKQRKDADERALALQALSEGDATLAMLLYGRKHMTLDELAQVQQQAGGLDQQRLDSAPFVLQASMLFPYQKGMEFVSALYQAGGWDEVDRAYANPPQSSEQIMHPDKYLQREGPERIDLPDIGPALGAGWSRLGSDTLGEFGWWVYLVNGLDPSRAAKGAAGWGGDSWLVYRDAAGRHALAALTVWDSAGEATEFYNTLRDGSRLRGGTAAKPAGATRFTWERPSDGGYVSLNGLHVLVVIAPDAATATKVADRFSGF